MQVFSIRLYKYLIIVLSSFDKFISDQNYQQKSKSLLITHQYKAYMVKGFDPVSSDLTSMMWNYIFHFWTQDPRLTLPEAQKYVRHWLVQSQQTSSIYNQFKSLSLKPVIRLRKTCRQQLSQFKNNDFFKSNDRQFPTSIKQQQITICLNHIQNRVQLKQNLDRELTFLYLSQSNPKKEREEQQERQLMKHIYESCYSGYRNYRLNDKITKEMSLICSKYLFFRKSENNLPLDRKFRYTTQLADELLL